MAIAQDDADLVVARKFQFIIGSTGILLPFLCLFYTVGVTHHLLSSISAHYYTPIHAVFIGTLCCLGICMLSYRGYSRLDNILSSIAGVAALLVGLCPTARPGDVKGPAGSLNAMPIIQDLVLVPTGPAGIIHIVCAISLFVILTIFAGFIFPRHKPMKVWGQDISIHIQDLVWEPICDFRYALAPNLELRHKEIPKEKVWRNLIYRWCAILMAGSLLLILVQYKYENLLSALTMFWGETIMVISFGISWLTKSKRGKAEIWEWISLCSVFITVLVILDG